MANCAELRSKYEELVLSGAPVLIKSGDQLVKYTDAAKLLDVIERLCGAWQPEGSTAHREVRFHVNRTSNPNDCAPCGGCGNSNDGWD